MPALQITSIDVPHRENLSKNGHNSELLYVVRNTAFNVRVGCQDHTLSKKICAELLFEDGKPVPQMNGEVVSYITHFAPDFSHATLDVKIRVLTTQLKSNFRLRIAAFDSASNSTSTVLSSAIKSVSKPACIRRRIDQLNGTHVEKRGVKRARGEDVFNALGAIKTQLDNQTALLQKLLDARTTPAPVVPVKQPQQDLDVSVFSNLADLSSFTLPAAVADIQMPDDIPLLLPSTCDDNNAATTTTTIGEPKSNSKTLESAFRDFLVAFQNEPAATRPNKMRKILDSAKTSDAGVVREFLYAVKDDTPATTCGANCPHKLELQAMDDIYTQFLS